MARQRWICGPCTEDRHDTCTETTPKHLCVCDHTTHPDAAQRILPSYGTRHQPAPADTGPTATPPDDQPVPIEPDVQTIPDDPTPAEVVTTDD